MKNYYYDIQNFYRAIRRNNVKKVFLHGCEFWFYTRKGCICHRSKDFDKLSLCLEFRFNVVVDRRNDV